MSCRADRPRQAWIMSPVEASCQETTQLIAPPSHIIPALPPIQICFLWHLITTDGWEISAINQHTIQQETNLLAREFDWIIISEGITRQLQSEVESSPSPGVWSQRQFLWTSLVLFLPFFSDWLLHCYGVRPHKEILSLSLQTYNDTESTSCKQVIHFRSLTVLFMDPASAILLSIKETNQNRSAFNCVIRSSIGQHSYASCLRALWPGIVRQLCVC